jgi:PAS domain S-box-containing protein
MKRDMQSPAGSVLALEQAVSRLALRDHLCLIYETQAEQFAAVIPFVRMGLERGEQCLYIADESTVDAVFDAMRAHGIDVDVHIRSGALSVVTKREAYLKDGYFDPDGMIRLLTETVGSAKAAGFKGLRATGEMTWALGTERGVDRLIEYETKLNYFFPQNDAVAICQYNRGRFPAKTILDIIRTHPLVIYGGLICRNAYYVPPDELLQPNQPGQEVERLLGNILDHERLSLTLQHSEERFRSLLGATAQIVWTTDPQGMVRWDLPAWREYTGQTLAEIQGNGWSAALHPDDASRVREAWRQAVAARAPYAAEYRIRRHDGEYRWFAVRGIPVFERDGSIREWVGACTDITEEKQAEQKIRTAALYARSLIEASLDPLVTIGPDGKITDVNAATEQVTGCGRAELIGTDFCDYFTEPEKARAGYQLVFARGFVTDYPLTIRNRHVTAATDKPDFTLQPCPRCGRFHGALTDVLYNASLFRDAEGRPLGVFAAARDVTERQRVERALRESSEILGRVFDTTHFCLVYLDRHFNFIMVNRAYAQACGYPPEFFPGKNHFALYPHAENEAIFREVVRSGQSATFIAKPFTFPDHPERGVTYWDWTLHPLKDAAGGVESLLFVLRDVTERRRAEDELRRLNMELEQRVAERTRELLAANRILAAEVAERKRAETRVQRQADVTSGVNRVLHETLTCETDTEVARVYLDVSLELTGSTLGFVMELNAAGRLDAVALNQAARDACTIPSEKRLPLLRNMALANFWERTVRTGRSQIVNQPESDPDHHGTPPGHAPIRRFLGVPLKENGRVIGVMGLANKETDYTEDDRQAAEALTPAFVEALKRKRAEQTVHRLHEELAARARSLEEANRELESFSYSVSHDLRAPLRSIDGFSRILLEEYTPKLDEEGQDSLRRLRGASQRMGELIDQLLKLSRMARGEMRYVPADLSAIAREIAAELGGSAPGRRVEWAITPGLTVVGDPTLLRVVLQNLLENAWKFTSRRSCAHIEFGATTTPEGGRAFFVRDDGAGFDPAYADKLFAPFQRMHTLKEFPGTGIGLATVQRIIRRHGGRVWAEAKTDAGAVFYFTLPPQPHRP